MHNPKQTVFTFLYILKLSKKRNFKKWQVSKNDSCLKNGEKCKNFDFVDHTKKIQKEINLQIQNVAFSIGRLTRISNKYDKKKTRFYIRKKTA